jgi:hypothetical protein
MVISVTDDMAVQMPVNKIFGVYRVTMLSILI